MLISWAVLNPLCLYCRQKFGSPSRSPSSVWAQPRSLAESISRETARGDEQRAFSHVLCAPSSLTLGDVLGCISAVSAE